MINKIKKSILISVLSLSMIIPTGITSFAENPDVGVVITDDATSNFLSDAREYGKLTGDTPFNYITEYQGKFTIHHGNLDDYAEYVFKDKPAAQYEEFKNSPYKLMLNHKGYADKEGTGVHYINDCTKKQPSDFYPPGADAKKKAFINWMFKRADERTNGGWSSGKTPGTIMYLTQKDIEDCAKDPTCVPPPELNITKTHEKPKKPSSEDIIYCEVGSGSEYKFTHTDSAGDDRLEGVYATLTKVIPIKPANFSKLTTAQQAEWMKTHKPQIIGPTKTAWGEYLDSQRAALSALRGMGKSGGEGEDSNYRKAWEEFAQGGRSAIAQGVPVTSIQLDADNARGNNRGAVFTFIELTKSATVETHHKQDKYDEYKCVPEIYPHTYIDPETGEKKSYDKVLTTYELVETDKVIDGQFTDKNVVAITGGSFIPSKSYQTLSVKCNHDEFNSVVQSTGSKVLTNTQAAGSARSPIKSFSVATFFNYLDVDFFYNGKSCTPIYGCTAEVSSIGDDRDNNKQDKGDVLNNSYGAQSDKKNSSEFAFFRDNQDKSVRVDIWYPKKRTDGGIEYKNEPAVKSYIILDKKGTPQEDFFKFKDGSGRDLITGKDLPNKWYTQLVGQVNNYKFAASWASDTDKPHRMMLIYGFKPKTSAEIPTVYNRKGGSTSVMVDIIDMLCTSQFNSTAVTDPIIIHQPKELTDESFSEFKEDPNSHFKVNFIKSSAE